MKNWKEKEFNRIAQAEELEIAGRKPDGGLHDATTIWVVEVQDDLYVRPIHGRESRWFNRVRKLHEGRIWAGGVEKDMRFEEVGAEYEINDQIDDAYNDKYKQYAQSIIDTVLSDKARDATLRLLPNEPEKE